MHFNEHSKLAGQHAFLGGSQYSWINYTPERLAERYRNSLAVEKGTELHAIAASLIKNHIRVREIGDKNFAHYVNDAIGFKMTPEQPLYYSQFVFGTADAISFYGNQLRIHDLKTGTTPAHIEQLEIYAALFCLEYDKKPGELEMELRIYQNGDIIFHNPSADEILPIMDKIVTFDRIISQIEKEET